MCEWKENNDFNDIRKGKRCGVKLKECDVIEGDLIACQRLKGYGVVVNGRIAATAGLHKKPALFDSFGRFTPIIEWSAAKSNRWLTAHNLATRHHIKQIWFLYCTNACTLVFYHPFMCNGGF